MADTYKILGIAGSLREKSFNRALLAAARDMAPDGMTIEIGDISAIPLYNEDVRTAGFPDAAMEFGRRISEADGVLIATPEYNYSVPGVLKNAIDWASRLPDQPFKDKPVAIMGAAAGRLGTARAQYHLRQVFVFLD
ncbi:MAG: NADPH-dependent FMN reductase, partial [Hyphomicrobiales bacterium]